MDLLDVRKQVAYEIFSSVPTTDLTKHVVFTTAVCGCSFIGAAILRYESVLRREKTRTLENRYSLTVDRLRRNPAQRDGFIARLSRWNDQHPGRALVTVIIGVNIMVFILWQIPRLNRATGYRMDMPTVGFLLKYFTCIPIKSNSLLSLTLSTFSHYNAIHLLFNMVTLWRISDSAARLFGNARFAAIYIGGGTFSSLIGFVSKIVRGKIVVSLGASGAILAVVGAVYCPGPDLNAQFVGDPSRDRIAELGVSVLLEVVLTNVFGFAAGEMAGRSRIDYMGHLGGVLFGIWYAKFGSALMAPYLGKIVNLWGTLRNKILN